jgi:hypothetical protein
VTGSLLTILSVTTAQVTSWLPPVQLRRVPVKDNCQQTRHRIGATLQPNPFFPQGAIFFCPQRAQAIDSEDPGASFFFLIHEYGHLALNTRDEAAADDWAANQLQNIPRGAVILPAVVRHFLRHAQAFDPQYGSNLDRAWRVAVHGGLPVAQWPPQLLRYQESRAQAARRGTAVRLWLPGGYLNQAELLLSVDGQSIGFLSTEPPSNKLICQALGAGRHVLTAMDVWLYHRDKPDAKKVEMARQLSTSCKIEPRSFASPLELVLRYGDGDLELAAVLEPLR